MAAKAPKTRASRPAAPKRKAAAAPAPARTSSVTRGGASTLAPASTTEDVLDLQSTVGNQAVVQLMSVQRAPVDTDDPPSFWDEAIAERKGETQSLVDAVTADADPTFNLTTIVDDLRRAIDQTDIRMEQRTVKGLLGDVEVNVLLRQVKVPGVIAALDNRTPSQIAKVKELYLSQEGTGLEHDLFELSKDGYPTDLKPEEAQRIRALLQGTKAEPVKADAPEAAKQAAGRAALDARAEADASEVQALLSGDLAQGGGLERLMALHRKPGPELDAMDAAFFKHTSKNLYAELEGKLSHAQLNRMNQLRVGNFVGADAVAIEELRLAADKLALNPMGDMDGSNAKIKAALAAGIDDVIDRNRTEAMAEAQQTGQSASAAIEGRMGALMGTKGTEEGTTLGSTLGDTFGDVGKAMAARGSQTSMQAHAAELVRMEDDKSTSTEKVAAILRAIRTEAGSDLAAWAMDPTTPAADRAALQAHLPEATTALAKDYIQDFRAAYDGMRGDHRTYSQIVDSASDEGSALLSSMVMGGGQAADVIQLEWAVSKKDVEQIKAVLARQPGAEAVAALEAAYDSEHPVTLRAKLFGTTREGKALPWEMARNDDLMDLPGVSKGVLEGREGTLVAQALAKPRAQDMGGAKEVGWLASFGQAEVTTSLLNQGATGALREIGGDPETEAILKETNGNLQAMADLWVDEEDALKRDRILQAMRLVRATLTGDAAAYEKDNAEVRASIRAVVSIAAQIALAVVLPGAGGLIANIAMQVGATVATNMLIYGKDYDLTMLRNDVLGGVAGGGGGALGKFLGKEVGLAAEAVASSISGDVAVAAVQGAKGAGIVSKLAGEAGGFYLGAKATEIVTGQDGVNAQGAEMAAVTGLIGHFRAPHVPSGGGGSGGSGGGGAGGGGGSGGGEGGGVPLVPEAVPTHVGAEGDAYTEPGMTNGIPETIGHDTTVPANPDPYEPTQPVTPDTTVPNTTPAPEPEAAAEAPVVDKRAETQVGETRDGGAGAPRDVNDTWVDDRNDFIPQEVTHQTDDPHEAARMLRDTDPRDHTRVMRDPAQVQTAWEVVSGTKTPAPVAWNDTFGNTYVDGTRAPEVLEPPSAEVAAPALADVAPGSVPEEVASLARGEGIPEIPTGEAHQASIQATDQAMAVINDPQSSPAQRAAAMQVLLERTVAEIRAFIKPYRMGREGVAVGQGASIELTPKILKDACGMGRDLSADLLAARVGDSPTPITIDRMQANHLGFAQNHAFAIVRDGANVYLVDATFGQFMDPEGTAGARNGDATANAIVGDAEGAAFAADLLRDGSVPLDQRSAELYLLSLGAPPERVEGMAMRMLGGDGAVMHDTIHDGVVDHEAVGVGSFDDADVVRPQERDSPTGGSIPMVDRFLKDLVPEGDPLRPALEEASMMLRRVLDLGTIDRVRD